MDTTCKDCSLCSECGGNNSHYARTCPNHRNNYECDCTFQCINCQETFKIMLSDDTNICNDCDHNKRCLNCNILNRDIPFDDNGLCFQCSDFYCHACESFVEETMYGSCKECSLYYCVLCKDFKLQSTVMMNKLCKDCEHIYTYTILTYFMKNKSLDILRGVFSYIVEDGTMCEL
jgi:hypothetical protein